MCSIISHDKQQPTYVDDKSSVGGGPIPNNATTESLKAMCSALNYIYFWLKLFHRNYEERYIMYHEAMKHLFKQIPKMK